MQRVLFLESFYDAGEVRFAAGQHYQPDENSLLCVARGIAKLIDVAEPAVQAADDATDSPPPAPAPKKKQR